MQASIQITTKQHRTMDLILQIITKKTEKYTISIIYLAIQTILWK